MKFKQILITGTFAFGIIAAGCHARKAAGTSQTVDKNVAVPPSGVRQSDTTTRTPTPRITPFRAPNSRPKPVPDTQPPVPPM
ncbi:hypothetical protein GCM10027037_11750 [Mucilaginibacter koreensis]